MLLFSLHLFSQIASYGRVLPVGKFILAAGRTVGRMVKTRDLPPNRHHEIAEAVLCLGNYKNFRDISLNSPLV